MTEADAQNIVAHLVHQRTDLAIVPNCTCLGHESDVLRLTKDRKLHEYEIKLTRSDFLRDRKKWLKGMLLRDLDRDGPSYRGTRWTPNQFWYAVVEGVASIEDVPKRAGLIVIDPKRDRARIERRATTIHSEPAGDRVVAYLGRGMTLRYWQERAGINPARDAKERERELWREHRERERERDRQRDAWVRQQAEAHA